MRELFSFLPAAGGKNEAANGVCSKSLLAGGTGTGQQMDGADGETLKQSLSSGFVG